MTSRQYMGQKMAEAFEWAINKQIEELRGQACAGCGTLFDEVASNCAGHRISDDKPLCWSCAGLPVPRWARKTQADLEAAAHKETICRSE